MRGTRQAELLTLTTDIVVAHIEHSEVRAEPLPDLVRAVYQALVAIGSSSAPARTPAAQEPAVPIRRSVFPDHIVCLEDGKKLRLLKRYIHVRYGMTPDDYRRKWGLPPNYPMAAPNYTQQRRLLPRAWDWAKASVPRSSRPAA